MDNETAFYIAGGTLVVLALITSFLGLRMNRFPGSKVILLAGVAVFMVVVGTTATFAWRNAEDEQAVRDAEEAAKEVPTPAEVDQAEREGTEAETTTTETTPGGGTTTTTAAVDGAQLFEEQGCSSCHTLQAAKATATVGPDLDTALKGESAGFIETSIVDPTAEEEKGYPPNTMPKTFGTTLSQEEIDALVQYLVESTSGK
jgi:mono/diheme cytochrome c family protein